MDLNRAGTAVLEIVTEPDIASADKAYTFCVDSQRLVRWLGISEADMQKGHIRFEPNINLAITTPDGREYRTPIIEIKNLNNFRSVRNAIAYEIDRQFSEWDADHNYTLEKLGKENRGWNDDRGTSEFSAARRGPRLPLFPDPDLTPVVPDEAWLKSIRDAMPELPLARQKRYMETFGISHAEAVQIVTDRPTADLYEQAITAGGDARVLARHFVSFWTMHANVRGVSIAEPRHRRGADRSALCHGRQEPDQRDSRGNYCREDADFAGYAATDRRAREPHPDLRRRRPGKDR